MRVVLRSRWNPDLLHSNVSYLLAVPRINMGPQDYGIIIHVRRVCVWMDAARWSAMWNRYPARSKVSAIPFASQPLSPLS